MIVIADSSPLIILAKLGCFDLLNKLYPRIYISHEVHHEVVIAGAGLPGAAEVQNSEWVEVRFLRNQASLLKAHQTSSLGLGELSTIWLERSFRQMRCCWMITERDR